MPNKNNSKLNNIELSYFFEQISIILKSGITPIEGLSVMLEGTSNQREKEYLSKLFDLILASGGDFGIAMSESNMFPDYSVKMVEIGVETGTLDDICASLSEYYRDEYFVYQNIKNAVAYPLLMATMMIAVILILLVKVMPIFNQVFRQLGSEMGAFATGLLNIGALIGEYSAVIVAVMIAILIFVLLAIKNVKLRTSVIKLFSRIKFIRNVREKISASRFAASLAIVLHSGINHTRGLELIAAMNQDENYSGKLELCIELVKQGVSIAESIKRANLFEGTFGSMICIAEKAGTMDKAMFNIAAMYKNDAMKKIDSLIATIEPAIVAVLSIIVGCILLAVMFPLMGIMSSI